MTFSGQPQSACLKFNGAPYSLPAIRPFRHRTKSREFDAFAAETVTSEAG